VDVLNEKAFATRENMNNPAMSAMPLLSLIISPREERAEDEWLCQRRLRGGKDDVWMEIAVYS
jgi:hypothetical protein